MKLYPVILTDSVEELQAQVDKVTDHPEIDVVQIDIIDGSLIDNLTVTPLDLKGVNFGKLQIDIHIMTEEPMDYVWETISIKESLPVRAIIAQVERMGSQENFIEEVKKQGWLTGLSLNLHTPLAAIKNNLLHELDIIQLMGIEAGFQGRKFQKQVLSKISYTKKLATHYHTSLEIMVDGGVKVSNARQILEAGATGLVVGSCLWKAPEIDIVISQFLEISN